MKRGLLKAIIKNCRLVEGWNNDYDGNLPFKDYRSYRAYEIAYNNKGDFYSVALEHNLYRRSWKLYGVHTYKDGEKVSDDPADFMRFIELFME